MLTGNLVLSRVRKDAIRPTWIDPEDEELTAIAAELLALHTDGVEHGWTRGELDEAIGDVVGHRRDHLVLKGLAKLLSDRSEFATETPIEPRVLREQVFRAARQVGPLALQAGPLGRPTAEVVLAEVGAEHGLDAAQVADLLYADLKSRQRILAVKVPDARWLLHRYNVAQAQALLLKADAVRVELHAPTAPRMRQLFRYVKFFQLLCAAERDGDTLVLTVDGPTSLFRQSTRYGRQLANFLPALLLQEGSWRMEAQIQWTKRRVQKRLVLDSGDGLVSHYRDRGAWRSKEQEYFADRFREADNGWTLAEGAVPIDLAGRAVVYPDFTLRRADGAEVHLEIVGFWRREWLERRLALLAEWGPGNLVVAVSSRLKGCREGLEGFDGAVVSFAEVLSPRKVVDAAEGLLG